MAKTNKKMTDNPVVQRMTGLIRQKGKNEKDLTDFLGLSPGAMSKWKYDGSFAYIKFIDEICEFLDTTPNYLFYGPADEEERLSPEEKEMIRIYRSLDDERKECIRKTLRFFSGKRRKT